MNRTAYGSYTHPDDPGEPATKSPRISVTEDEAAFLRFLAEGRRVTEIGTGLGVSTRAMAEYASYVFTVDNDPWVQDHVWPALADTPTIYPCKIRPEFYTEPPDMIFIDGEHKTLDTRDDIDWALRVCQWGMIVVHDAHMDTVKQALSFYDGFHTIDTYHGMAVKYVGWT